MKLNEESRKYTAFSACGRHYQFTRLVQGLAASPAAFQREIMKMRDDIQSLEPREREKILAFLDDLLVPSGDFDEHFKSVEGLLQTLIRYDLKIKPSKCNFFANEVRFLGYICSEKGTTKPQEFFREIEKFERPTTVKELRSFLGIVGFYRSYMKDLATDANPLNRLLGEEDKKKIEWDQTLINSYEDVKALALKEVQLAYPDYNSENKLVLTVDASLVAAGYYLSQKDDDGNERVIAYGSNTFTKSQRAYSATDRELQAVRMGILSFKDLLGLEAFVVRTDHMALIYLTKMALCNARLARTLIDISDYNFTIEHISGRLNVVADGLSRLGKHWESREVETTPETEPHEPEGLKIVFKPEGGGDSLFECLLEAIKRSKWIGEKQVKTVPQLRDILASELEKNANKFGIELTKESRRKIGELRVFGQPVYECLDAFAMRFNCRIILHFGTQFPLVIEYNNEAETVNLQWKDKVHFNLYEPIGNSGEVNKISWCNHGRSNECTIDVQVGNTTLCALVDTGSSISIISEERYWDFKANSAIVWETTVEFELDAFSGQVYESKQKVVDINCRVGNSECIIKFVVLKGDYMEQCMLLGTNVLLQMDWALDLGKMALLDVHDEIVGNLHNRILEPLPQRTAAKSAVIPIKASVKMASNSRDLQAKDDEFFGEIDRIQRDDFVLSTIKQCIIRGQPLPPSCKRFKSSFKNLKVVRGILFNIQYDAVVVSFHAAVGYCVEIHLSHCHVGKAKVLELVRQDIFHPSLDKICEDVCFSCERCQKAKFSGVKAVAPILKVTTSYPGEIVSVDLMTLPSNNEKYVGVFTAIDLHSKVGMAVPIKNKTGAHIASLFEHRIMSGFVFKIKTLLSDHGKEFESSIFNEVLDRYGIAHYYSNAGLARANGSCERFNKTLQQLLNLQLDDMRFWPAYLPKALMVYNGTVHTELKCSPREFLISKSHAIDSNAINSPRIREYWSRGNANFRPFFVGDKVLIEIRRIGDCTRYKLMDKFSGPWRVVQVCENLVTYVVEGPEGKRETTHYNFMRAFREPPEYLKHHEVFLRTDLQEDAEITALDGTMNASNERIRNVQVVIRKSDESSLSSESFGDNQQYQEIADNLDQFIHTMRGENDSMSGENEQSQNNQIVEEYPDDIDLSVISPPIQNISGGSAPPVLCDESALVPGESNSNGSSTIRERGNKNPKNLRLDLNEEAVAGILPSVGRCSRNLRSRGQVPEQVLPSTPIEYKSKKRSKNTK